MTELFRLAAGYVSFEVSGGSCERFISECCASGIKFWDLTETPAGLSACVRAGKYRRLRKFRQRFGVKLRVVSRHGLPFYAARHRRRFGVLAGAAAFFLILWAMSQFIWDIKISGNSLITDEEITEALTRCGISVGMPVSAFDPDISAAELMLDDPDLAWIALNRRGTTLYVELKERVLPPDMLPDTHPCNVVAGYTGKLLKLEVYSGVPNALDGDGIAKGQLLISGIVTDREGAVRLVHARGRALAEIKLADSETVALSGTEVVPSEDVKVRCELSLFGLRIPLYFKGCESNEYTEATEKKLTVFGNRYPLSLITIKYRDAVKVEEELTEEEAVERGKKALESRLADIADGMTVSGREYICMRGENSVTVAAVYTCTAEIGVENEILTQ